MSAIYRCCPSNPLVLHYRSEVRYRRQPFHPGIVAAPVGSHHLSLYFFAEFWVQLASICENRQDFLHHYFPLSCCWELFPRCLRFFRPVFLVVPLVSHDYPEMLSLPASPVLLSTGEPMTFHLGDVILYSVFLPARLLARCYLLFSVFYRR